MSNIPKPCSICGAQFQEYGDYNYDGSAWNWWQHPIWDENGDEITYSCELRDVKLYVAWNGPSKEIEDWNNDKYSC